MQWMGDDVKIWCSPAVNVIRKQRKIRTLASDTFIIAAGEKF